MKKTLLMIIVLVAVGVVAFFMYKRMTPQIVKPVGNTPLPNMTKRNGKNDLAVAGIGAGATILGDLLKSYRN